MAKRSRRATIDLSQALANVAADLRAGRPKQALVGLLAIWSERRVPEIAAAIEALSRRLTPAYPPLPNATRREFDRVWTTRFLAGDPVERGLLLERALEGAGPDLCRRMELLAALPPDPRIASTILRAVLHWNASPRSKAWTAMHRALRAHADPRTLTALGQLEYSAWRRRGGEDRTMSRVRKVLAKQTIALSDAEQAAVAALGELIQQGRGVDRGVLLLADVHAHPDDLDRRRVYADWLAQRGDPRGEFITLQLLELDGDPNANEPAVRKRIAALRATHETAWLGRLAGCFCEKSVCFIGGFPVSGRVRSQLRNPGSFVDAPEWATFRSLVEAPAAILRSSTLHALTEIRVDDHAAARLLEARLPIPRVRRLVVDAPTQRWGVGQQCAIWRASDARGLPELRELSVIYDGPLGRVRFAYDFDTWGDRLARRFLTGIELLELTQAGDEPLDVAGWVQTLRDSRCRTISRLRLRHGELVFDIEREGDEWSRVHAHGVADAAASSLRSRELLALAKLRCEVRA